MPLAQAQSFFIKQPCARAMHHKQQIASLGSSHRGRLYCALR